MNLDLPTLMAIGALVTMLASVFAFVAWIADRDSPALPWWSAGYFVLAAGIASLFVAELDPQSPWTFAGSILISIAPALLWTGARVLGDRRPMLGVVVVGPFLTLLALTAGAVLNVPMLGSVTHLATTATYLTFAVIALWRHPEERLRSRPPLIFFMALHASVFIVGTIEATLDLLPRQGFVGFGLLFGIINVEQFLFAMGSSVFVVAMVRERNELRHKAAAAVDVLTGIATRRAFVDKAKRDLAACLERSVPLSLMMFDIDHFKSVNDTFGHAAGDQVLQRFAEVARSRLRTRDFAGRIGGEEFAVIAPGSSAEAAYFLAERIRRAFAESCCVLANGETLRATVSAGVATAQGGSTLEHILSAADTALYRAKSRGRNRVEVAEKPDGNDGTSAATRPSSVIRVA